MRIKRGHAKKRRHNKVLKSAKGYRLTYSKLYRRAKEAVAHAGNYNFMHRKHRAGQKREEWIKTISAALAGGELSYSKFINGLKKANIQLDRKSLATMAVDNPEHFQAVVKEVA